MTEAHHIIEEKDAEIIALREKLARAEATNWEKDYRYQIERMGQDREAFNVAVRELTAKTEKAEAALAKAEADNDILRNMRLDESAAAYKARLARAEAREKEVI